MEVYRRKEEPLPERTSGYPVRSVDYPLPCHLPSCFAQVVAGIIEGTSLIRFDGFVGDLWDREDLISIRQSWTIEEWMGEWRSKVLAKKFRTKVMKGLPSRHGLPDRVTQDNTRGIHATA